MGSDPPAARPVAFVLPQRCGPWGCPTSTLTFAPHLPEWPPDQANFWGPDEDSTPRSMCGEGQRGRSAWPRAQQDLWIWPWGRGSPALRGREPSAGPLGEARRRLTRAPGMGTEAQDVRQPPQTREKASATQEPTLLGPLPFLSPPPQAAPHGS